MKTVHLNFSAFTIIIAMLVAAAGKKGPVTPGKDNFSFTVDLSKLKSPVQKLFFTFYNTTTKQRYADSAPSIPVK